MRKLEKEFLAEIKRRNEEHERKIDAAFQCKMYLPNDQPKKKKKLSTKLLKRDF